MRESRVARTFLLLAFLFLGSPDAVATPILTSGEPDLVGDWNLVLPPFDEGILGYLYGWNNVTRVDDLSDRWWSIGAGAEARPVASFAGDYFDFGLLDPTGQFQNILSWTGEPTGFGYINLPGVHFASTDPLNRFALRSFTSGTVFDSAQADDHMVTFQITGNTDQYGRDFSANIIGNYILAWEDLPFSISDRDYNDFILELHGSSPTMEPMPVIPEPSTALLVASGLSAMAVHFRRRRNR